MPAGERSSAVQPDGVIIPARRVTPTLHGVVFQESGSPHPAASGGVSLVETRARDPGQTRTAFMSATTIPTVYELTVPGRHGIDLPVPDVPQTPLPANELRDDCGLPELSLLDVVRHYLAAVAPHVRHRPRLLSARLVHDEVQSARQRCDARQAGFAELHPFTPDELAQGALQVMYELERTLELALRHGGVLAQSVGRRARGARALLIAAILQRTRRDRAR